MRLLKKMISALLVICMVISLVPVAAFATESGAVEPAEGRIMLDQAILSDAASVWVDGVEYAVQTSGESCYVDLPADTDPGSMVTYSYYIGDAADVHTQYPVGMQVWKLNENEDGSFTPEAVEELENILQYSGSSIRITGNKGIRMITSIEKNNKKALVSDAGLGGYKLLEYGTVVAKVSNLADGAPLILGPDYAKFNYAYKKDEADPVFKYEGDLMQYTNVLVGFTLDECKEDLAMRSYMILEDENGEQMTIYGGIVQRSIGYIAWQNRDEFKTGSTAYNYVWEIIRHVYAEVTFETNGGSEVESVFVEKGGTIEMPAAPTKDGYTFGGWYTDEALTEEFDFTSVINENLTLYAKWEANNEKTLPDEIKDALGLSKDTDDSDSDGLTDYDELMIVGTDPLKYDTDNDGVCDAEDDEDSDGLSNLEEVQLGTLPTEADSDFDCLNDCDEINTYGTDPLVADSDGDGLTDGEEIDLGLDPMNPQTDGITPDAERTFEQTASNDAIMDLELRNSDNWLTPTIEGNVPGNIDNNILLEKSSTSAFNDNRAVLSDVIDLSTNYESTSLTLSFTYSEFYTGTMNNLTIVSFGEDGLEIVDTTIDESEQTLSGEILGSGTYFVIDLDEFLKGLGINVFDNIVYPTEGGSLYKSSAPDVGTPEEMPDCDYLYDNDGNIIAQITDNTSAAEKQGFSAFSPAIHPFAASSGATGKADVVFVIDTTGSMSDAIYGVKENVNVFAEKLVSDYNVDANFALIEYRDINVDGMDSTKIHKNNTSNWFTNVGVFRSEVDSLYVNGGGDWEETPIDGLEMARRLDWRSDATKFIVLVTDAPYWNDNRYGISDMAEMMQLLVNDGIIVSAISYDESIYQVLTDATDGLYGYIYGNFSDILLQLAEKVGEVTNQDGEWVFLDDFQAVKLSNTLDNANSHDTDDDGLVDAQELGTSVVVDMLPYITSLTNRYDVPIESYTGKTQITVWKYRSNPVRVDTDYDGTKDKDDSNPRKWDISDRDLAIAAGISYTNLVKGAKIETYSSIDLGSGADVNEMVGWTVLDTWHGGAGFYAAALKKDKNIILTFRGSKPGYDGFIDIDWIDDWVFADVINVMTGISTQAPAAQAFTKKIVNNYSGYNIYICGHSLGGNLALNASIKALEIKPSVVKRVTTFNGLGMPNVKVLTELFTWDFSTLASYKERFYDYEIEGDPVSAFEFAPDHKWYEIFDLALTTGVGHRIVKPLKVSGNAHGLENFYLQMEPFGRPIS